MQQADQQAHEPKGPTTGPLRPVIVVMDTIDDEEEEDPRLDEGNASTTQRGRRGAGPPASRTSRGG